MNITKKIEYWIMVALALILGIGIASLGISIMAPLTFPGIVVGLILFLGGVLIAIQVFTRTIA